MIWTETAKRTKKVYGYRFTVIGYRLSVADGCLQTNNRLPRAISGDFLNHETHEIHEKVLGLGCADAFAGRRPANERPRTDGNGVERIRTELAGVETTPVFAEFPVAFVLALRTTLSVKIRKIPFPSV